MLGIHRETSPFIDLQPSRFEIIDLPSSWNMPLTKCSATSGFPLQCPSLIINVTSR